MTKLLLIEDDELIVKLYQKIFSLEGWELKIAVDGQEGWKMIKDWRPTIILLDVVMPKMNGIEVLRKLKADPDVKQIPVIVLTNLAGKKDANEALRLGADKYLVKSQYDAKQIANEVKKVIEGSMKDNSSPKKE